MRCPAGNLTMAQLPLLGAAPAIERTINGIGTLAIMYLQRKKAMIIGVAGQLMISEWTTSLTVNTHKKLERDLITVNMNISLDEST